ncbi:MULTISPECIES: Tim44 domain-containing protein [unclassified Mesorhizobium]|uniref:Tim44 domain-containing protein n=1 Tax=unclassified Mesorhizobium TaxID=325217 RepID=UPI001CCED401|nr:MULTISPECIES: Tim44 domain-containing protein [unclassified Mesorhizobium]MBZ9738892.1 Tim44 domain-containing protein [Mesorhizobium sp. CO1-1-4]MBZ9802805.1 Tim44 domain-containing protein [Mesorhizobium sp. ES1-6]
MISRTSRFVTLLAGLFLAFSMVAIDHAEARRGGSFGSRGTRTFQSAPPTRTAPAPAAPVERSMTPNTGVNNAVRQPQAGPQRPGFMSGFGGTMMRGLLIGGLIGLLLGQGFGGLAGMFGFLLQALLIGGAIMLAIRFFRSQSARGPVPAIAGMGNAQASRFENRATERQDAGSAGSFTIPGFGGEAGGGSAATESEEITLAQTDLDAFQQLLTEVQEAFGREDHAALRRSVTPEMVSYLSEELADNAQKGLRNEVSDIHLLQADIAESWREDDRDYATAALRYESRDVTRERASGKVVDGDEDHPTETTELWTFTRQNGSSWKLSAIQQA